MTQSPDANVLTGPTHAGVSVGDLLITTGLQQRRLADAIGGNGITPAGLFNVTPQNFPNWRKAVANVRAGTGRATLLLLGDSTTMGAGAGTSGALNLVDAYPKAYPRDLAVLLAKSVAVMDNSFFCDQASSVSYVTYDTRVTMGTGWTNAFASLGGSMFRFTVGTAGLLTFTPITAFDRIKVWFVNSAVATATVNVDGGASLGTLTSVGGNTVTSQTFNCALATHTINLTPANDGQLAILGMETWNSAVTAVDFIQSGVSGAKVANFVLTTPPFSSGATVIALLAPDLTVIDLTINDSNALTNLALYTTQMQTLINSCKASGDVLLMVGPPSNTPQATNGTLDQYAAVLQSLALSNNCGLLSLKTRWVSWAVTNPVLPYFDNLHPGSLGYQDFAQAVFGAIGNV